MPRHLELPQNHCQACIPRLLAPRFTLVVWNVLAQTGQLNARDRVWRQSCRKRTTPTSGVWECGRTKAAPTGGVKLLKKWHILYSEFYEICEAVFLISFRSFGPVTPNSWSSSQSTPVLLGLNEARTLDQESAKTVHPLLIPSVGEKSLRFIIHDHVTIQHVFRPRGDVILPMRGTAEKSGLS